MSEEAKQTEKVPVVIIGGGLTGLSLAAQLDIEDVPFLLLERAGRFGGQVRTLKENGYTFEVGPNTGTVSTPEVVELFEYGAPVAQLEEANKASNSRWIWKKGRFHPIPSGIWSGLKTPLYTWRDKLMVPFEPFKPRGKDPNETVGQLAERRLGRSIVDYTIDPFIGGIYAGAPYQLVTRLALPKLYALEQKYGSFIGGAIKKAREPKTDREKMATKKIFSAKGGLENLVAGVVQRLQRSGRALLHSIKEVQCRPIEGDNWEVEYRGSDGALQRVQTPHVVTTVRADQLSAILPSEWMDAYGFRLLTTLPYAPVTEVSVGFDHLPQVPRAAFGALVPSKEERRVLGILFPSSCFTDRTPHHDSALFTIFMGGLRDKQMLTSLPLEEQMAIALEELYDMMKLPEGLAPDLTHIEYYPKAIPQYDLETDLRHKHIATIEQEYPGLHLAGGMIGGIGMANRIEQGMKLGRDLANKIKGGRI